MSGSHRTGSHTYTAYDSVLNKDPEANGDVSEDHERFGFKWKAVNLYQLPPVNSHV